MAGSEHQRSHCHLPSGMQSYPSFVLEPKNNGTEFSSRLFYKQSKNLNNHIQCLVGELSSEKEIYFIRKKSRERFFLDKNRHRESGERVKFRITNG